MWRNTFPYRYLPAGVVDWLDPRLEDHRFIAKVGAGLVLAGLIIVFLANMTLKTSTTCTVTPVRCTSGTTFIYFVALVLAFMTFAAAAMVGYRSFVLKAKVSDDPGVLATIVQLKESLASRLHR